MEKKEKNNEDEFNIQQSRQKRQDEKEKSESSFLTSPFSEDEEKEANSDTYFLRGMLTGVLFTIFIGVIFFSIKYFWIDGNTQTSTDGISLDYDSITDKLEVLEQYVNYVYLDEADAEEIENGIYNGFVSGLGDKYAAYYSEDEYADLMESTDGEYCGIGAYVNQNQETGQITIVSPFEDGPADKAGILSEDIIYSVDDQLVNGMELDEVVSAMKGTAGTVVKVGILRGDSTDPIYFDITLEDVEVPTVSYELMDDGIGYIKVSRFDKVTSTQFRTALDTLEAQGMEGLVIDLRDNPGGVLTAVTDMLDRMIKEGTLVYMKDKNGEGDTYTATDEDSFDKPFSVLINGNSASASELFAGAIQDYGIGTLVGTTSYGKGIVQNIYGLGDGSALKLTVSKYYTPKGRNIQGIGIEPDVTVELDESLAEKTTITKDEDNQLQEAIKIVKQKLK